MHVFNILSTGQFSPRIIFSSHETLIIRTRQQKSAFIRQMYFRGSKLHTTNLVNLSIVRIWLIFYNCILHFTTVFTKSAFFSFLAFLEHRFLSRIGTNLHLSSIVLQIIESPSSVKIEFNKSRFSFLSTLVLL